MDYINSEAYAKKFKGLTGNTKADSTLLKVARAILTHRTGTAGEDLYLVWAIDGEVKGSQVASKTPLGVAPNQSIMDAVANEPVGSLYGIHNHPSNIPPTGSDFVTSGALGYGGAYVTLHNGELYYYKHGSVPFTREAFDMTVASYMKRGNKEAEAVTRTLRDFEERYGITWRKIS